MLARAAKAPRSGRRACGFHKTFKRRDSPYRWGRSRDWIKSKKPNAPAVKRRPKTSQLGETCIDEVQAAVQGAIEHRLNIFPRGGCRADERRHDGTVFEGRWIIF